MWYVYILKCNNGTYYTGCTNNIEDRLKRHTKGEIHYTKDKLPVELVTYIAFSDKYKAFQFEKYLKFKIRKRMKKLRAVVIRINRNGCRYG